MLGESKKEKDKNENKNRENEEITKEDGSNLWTKDTNSI